MLELEGTSDIILPIPLFHKDLPKVMLLWEVDSRLESSSLDVQFNDLSSKMHDAFPASFDWRNKIPSVREKKKSHLKCIISKGIV